MQIVEPYARITQISGGDGVALMRNIEECARTSYRSEGGQTDTSYLTLLPRLFTSAHMSVFEHGSITVEFCVDRGVSHELVRHRLLAFTQESTRYCNYSKEKFGSEIKVIKPEGLTSNQMYTWREAIYASERAYLTLLDRGVKAQIARDVLPTCLATTVRATGNPRVWRHVLLQRTHTGVHPKFLQVSLPLLAEFKARIPVLYDDIEPMGEQSANLRKPQ